MPLFNPSTLPWVSAVQQIADSAGASADSEMTTRAHNSLRAAFQWFQGKAGGQGWNFLRAESTPLAVVAPFGVTGVSASAGQTSAAAPAGHGFVVDDLLSGDGFVRGTRVTATAAGGLGFTAALTGLAAGVNVITATGTRDLYDLPSDWKAGYTVRLLGAQRTLFYAGRRAYDRAISDELATDSVYRYDYFHVGGKGKIRLLSPPASSDTLLQRYYRRFTLASASGATGAIDCPEDYESFLVAYGKFHFLTDKAEGRSNQATIWFSLAQDGLKTMLAENVVVPDEDLGFIPGHYYGDHWSPNSTGSIPWDY